MTYRVLPAILLIPVLLLVISIVWPDRDPSKSGALVFPDKEWSRLTPERAGFDPQRLKAMEARVGGAGCLVLGGRLVHAWGPYDQHTDVASVLKPLIVHLTLKAYEEGLITDLDHPVALHQPGLAELNAELGYKDRQITWRHMMHQTSGYGVSEAPGEAFNYCDRQMALYWDTLIQRVYKTSFAEASTSVMGRLLTGPLYSQDRPKITPRGRLHISAADLARIGLLYLSGGRWEDRLLLHPRHVKMAVSSPHPPELPRTSQQETEMFPNQRTLGGGANLEHHLNSYSYGWWTNGIMDNGERVLPAVPADTFGAFGHGGRHALVVIPSLKLVISWVAGLEDKQWFFSRDGRREVNEVIRLALAARRTGPKTQPIRLAALDSGFWPELFNLAPARLQNLSRLYTRPSVQ